MSAISTRSLSPTLTTSSTFAMRLPLPSLEMCTRPSRPGSSDTNAPKSVVLTTVPRNRSPTVGSCGLAMALIMSIAACAEGPSVAPTNTVPSSSMEICAPVCSVIELIILPLGPMTSPILSTGTLMVVTRGAYGLISSGASMASAITSRIVSRASLACASAPASTCDGIPSSLVSSCSAVTKSLVPAHLKSMSPNASSAPRMSVRVTKRRSRLRRPQLRCRRRPGPSRCRPPAPSAAHRR